MRVDPGLPDGVAERLAHFQHVNILAIEPVGNYAVRLVFSDGHQTGIYSWETLARLAERWAVSDRPRFFSWRKNNV